MRARRQDGKNKRQIVKEISKVGATFPNWSPDSQRIVYSFPVGGALELFIVNLDGSGQRQLTTFGGTSAETKRVVEAMKAAGGHFINRFGRLSTEEFARWQGPEPPVSSLMKH